MSRKRIVIDLDSPGATASSGSPGGPTARAVNREKKRRLWPRVLGILFVLMLLVVGVVALVGFFAWRHYQSTPAYTLALMIDAAQRSDVPEFQKRLDDEEIARNMVTGVCEKAAARYGLALSNTVKARIDSTMPSMLQEIKPAIRDEVTKEIQTFAAKMEPQPFIIASRFHVTSLRSFFFLLSERVVFGVSASPSSYSPSLSPLPQSLTSSSSCGRMEAGFSKRASPSSP